MGEYSAKTTKKSTMVVESHITYDQEVKEGDEVDINLIYCDHDKKRIQYKLEMIHSEKKYLAATLEALKLLKRGENALHIFFMHSLSMVQPIYL